MCFLLNNCKYIFRQNTTFCENIFTCNYANKVSLYLYINHEFLEGKNATLCLSIITDKCKGNLLQIAYNTTTIIN